MRTNFLFFGIGLGILLGTPALAQVESTQQQTTTAPAPNITQEQAPAMPSIQDVRGPLNTISNRPRAATGTQAGAVAGTGQAGLTPGARTVFPGSDLQLRIQEFQFQQLQEDLQAEQRERNEFQQFVMQSIGRDLAMFGANLFRTVPSTFAPVDNVPVAADYVVGPGDRFTLSLWGKVNGSFPLTVGPDGKVVLPRAGAVTVWGQTLEKVQNAAGELETWMINEMEPNTRLRRYLARAQAWPDPDPKAALSELADLEFF